MPCLLPLGQISIKLKEETTFCLLLIPALLVAKGLFCYKYSNAKPNPGFYTESQFSRIAQHKKKF